MPGPVVAVVGAGQAGFQAASSLRQEGFAGRVVLIGDEPGLPYQRPPLSKSYLAGESGLDELLLRPGAFYEKQGIELVSGDAVTAIDRPGRRLRLASGGMIECDHLVLATGARCRTCRCRAPSSTASLRCAPWPMPTSCASGWPWRVKWSSSAPGLSASNSPRSRSARVARCISSRSRRIRWAGWFRRETSRFFTGAHRDWGATISLGAGITRILGDGRRVTAVETTDGRVLPADLVLVCIGVLPNAELAARGRARGR